jgi:ribose 5-phosphate isomerase A
MQPQPSASAVVEAGASPEALDRVALAALKHVRDGMRLGLGTGRAAEAFIGRLGERVAQGLSVVGVTTSERSERLAESLGIPRATLGEIEQLDIDFDGADEVTPELFLTKGRGGALVRERIVAHVAKRFIVLVTPEKLVPQLGARSAIPIVVVPFAVPVVRRELSALGGEPVERRTVAGASYRTDDGGCILDTKFAPIADPLALDRRMRRIPGVVDTGLFLNMAELVLVGGADRVEELSQGGR